MNHPQSKPLLSNRQGDKGNYVKRDIRYFEKLIKEKTDFLEDYTKKLEKEIRENKSLTRMIEHIKREWERTVDAIPDLIALIDRNFNFVRLNKAMANVMGLTPKEAVGLKCYKAFHNADAPPDFCPHKKLLKDGKQHKIEFFDERRQRYYEVIVVPYKEADGTTSGCVHVARDITERKRSEKEKELLHAQLLHSQKLESVGQLAAGIAHEINTPAQYIASNIDFLDEGFKDVISLIEEINNIVFSTKCDIARLISSIKDLEEEIDLDYLKEEIPTAIEQTREGISKITSIVRAMKEFSHPGSKEKELSNINKIIETTLTISRNEWKYVAEMETDLSEDLPPISCLANELGQVFLNLIVNAVHAIQERLGDNSEDKGKITIRTKKGNDGFIEISISDTGVGIREEIKDRIFDPFFTTKEVGKGTGQGLAIVRNVVVDKHGGSIDFKSRVGEGTTFYIRLPITSN